MSSSFEAQHPRCGHCGAWGQRYGDKIQCRNPRCARTSEYTAPQGELIPVVGYRLPKPRRSTPHQLKTNPAQPAFNFDEDDDDEPDQPTLL